MIGFRERPCFVLLNIDWHNGRPYHTCNISLDLKVSASSCLEGNLCSGVAPGTFAVTVVGVEAGFASY